MIGFGRVGGECLFWMIFIRVLNFNGKIFKILWIMMRLEGSLFVFLRLLIILWIVCMKDVIVMLLVIFKFFYWFSVVIIFVMVCVEYRLDSIF